MSLLHERLRNQQLVKPAVRTPAETVAWLGAMQSQDYAGAKWAIGQRLSGITDADVERAFDDGLFLRTHMLRPTWHFVAPADIRWMLALTSPRVQAFNAPYYRKHSLSRTLLVRSRTTIERALARGAYLTRAELQSELRAARIPTDGTALALLVMHAELEGAICSGPRRGKQFTYALLDERAPKAIVLGPDEALGELTRRYFTSHGPATIRDFSWWSGLRQRDGKRGTEIAGKALAPEAVDGLTYWRARDTQRAGRAIPTVHLLPNYDEYLVAYKDRHLGVPVTRVAIGMPRERDPFTHHVVIDGQLRGSWGRTISARSVDVDIACYEAPSPGAARLMERSVARYRAFIGRPTRLRYG